MTLMLTDDHFLKAPSSGLPEDTVLAILLFIAGFGVLLAVTIFPLVARRRTKPCRWVRDAPRSSARSMDRFVCRTCGVEGFTTSGRPPATCKRNIRETPL